MAPRSHRTEKMQAKNPTASHAARNADSTSCPTDKAPNIPAAKRPMGVNRSFMYAK